MVSDMPIGNTDRSFSARVMQGPVEMAVNRPLISRRGAPNLRLFGAARKLSRPVVTRNERPLLGRDVVWNGRQRRNGGRWCRCGGCTFGCSLFGGREGGRVGSLLDGGVGPRCGGCTFGCSLFGGRQEGRVDQLSHDGFDPRFAEAFGERAGHLVERGPAVALGGADQEIGPGSVLVVLGLPRGVGSDTVPEIE